MNLLTRPAAKTALCEGTIPLEACRICGGTEFHPVIDVHRQYIGNPFPSEGPTWMPRAPLQVVRCTNCSLVQLAHHVNDEFLYEAYGYRSGASQTMRDHLLELVAQATEVAGLREGDVVMDIGCNDGTLLKCYPTGVTRIGVDRSNVRPEGCDTFVHDQFSYEAVQFALQGRRAKLITSIAVFSALDDPSEFAHEVGRCLQDDGVWVAELSYLPAMIDAVAYDAISHEHACYHRIATFVQALEGSGLEVFDVTFNDIHGGSFRLFVARRGMRKPTDRYAKAKVLESRKLFDSNFPYQGFRNRVARAREDLLRFLRQARADRKTVYGYRVSGNGMVALSYCGLTADLISAIAEPNPRVSGRFVPGTSIPICTEAEMRAARPDYLLVFPWHLLDELRAREQAYLASGGKLVVALPELEIYSSRD